MCLILVREPEVTLDYDKIKNACLNNPDGWGYVIPDRGKLEVRRFFSSKGNDPDEVYDVLDTHLDKRVFLHLRFCTAGDRNKANVHPFPVLQQRKHGMQAWLMHNGTVSEYKQSKMSDTFHFTSEVVSPLLQRVMSYTGKKGAITDPFVGQVIKKFAGGWSKFVLIDQYGGYQIIGDSDASGEMEGYWASNDYSFRPSYRTTKSETKETPKPYQYSYNHNTKKYEREEDFGHGYPNYGAPWYGNNYGKVDKYEDATDAEYEDVAVGDERADPFAHPALGTQDTSTKALPPPAKEPQEVLDLTPRTKFLEIMGMESLQELTALEYKDVLDMINELPETMAVLMMDLIWELYNDDQS